jgi:hypothetical protein
MSAAGLQSSGYTVTTTPANISGLSPGSSVTVNVQCTWGTVGLRPLQLISAAKIVKGQAVMRKE